MLMNANWNLSLMAFVIAAITIRLGVECIWPEQRGISEPRHDFLASVGIIQSVAKYR